MGTLTVLKFSTPDGAEQALEKLVAMQKQELIKLQDAAIVTWLPGKKKPKTRQGMPTVAAGALGGTFWGMLFGMIFLMPFLGAAIGAAMGALTGAFTDYGINDEFIKKVREQVTEGTSALFVLSSNEVVDRVIPELKPLGPEIISSNLSAEQEAQLRAAFAEDDE